MTDTIESASMVASRFVPHADTEVDVLSMEFLSPLTSQFGVTFLTCFDTGSVYVQSVDTRAGSLADLAVSWRNLYCLGGNIR